jgi:hypothetical protein
MLCEIIARTNSPTIYPTCLGLPHVLEMCLLRRLWMLSSHGLLYTENQLHFKGYILLRHRLPSYESIFFPHVLLSVPIS